MQDQWICTISGEVMDDFGNIIDIDYDLCKGCNKPMWLEGTIYKKINICHLCYENKYKVICARCKTEVSFNEVSGGYFAVCPEHYEDLFQFETEVIIRDKGQE